MKNFFNSELWKWIKVLIEIAIIAAVLLGFYSAFMSIAKADTITEEVWILCEPKGTVNIRSTPGGRIFGGATCGDKMWTDNRQKNGFIHVLDLAAEEENGWVSARYVIFDEPEEVNIEMTVDSDGRVACRKFINGNIKGWVYDGDKVFVYWTSDEWSITNKGYIKSEFLEMDGGLDDESILQDLP